MVLVFLFVVILQRTFKKNQFSVMNGRAVCLLVLFPYKFVWELPLDIFSLLIIRHNQKQFVRIFAAKVRRCNYCIVSLSPLFYVLLVGGVLCSSERAGESTSSHP